MNVQDLLDKPGDYRQVKIAVGGDGKEYRSTDSHFNVSGSAISNAQIVFLLPDTVAEFYRQEGRRQLQAEMRALLNVSRA